MSDEQKTVFISYRHDVSQYIARTIFMHLREHGYDVFLDVESIDSGEFERIILNQIAARAHFLVILTPGTVERCAEPGDWLRREIEHALDLRRNTVPVITYDFTFKGTEQYLTGKLANLSRYNALPLYYEYFDEGMERLRTRFLKQPVYGEIRATPRHDQPVVERKITEAASQPAPTEEELTAEEYFSRGVSCQENNDLYGAITNYTAAIRLNPRHIEAFNNRGVAYRDQGNLDEAFADFDQAIRLDPQDADAYVNRGNARQDQGDLGKAIADYRHAIRLNPQLAEAFNNRGKAHADQGDLAGAITDFDQALYLNPHYAEAYSNRGLARQAQGNLTEAIADHDQAVRLNPQFATAYNNRGAAYYNLGNLAEAITDYDEAIRLNPQYAETYNNRGEVYFVLTQYDQALVDFRKANDLMPGYNFALAGLAITHHVLGNTVEAKRLWRLLIAMDENYRDAEWVRNELNWDDPLVEEAYKLIASL